MADLTLQLPFPPSVNSVWRCMHSRNILSQKGRDYRAFVIALMEGTMADVRKFENRLRVDIVLHPPTRRKYDIDNFHKALLDALTHAGIWEDDEQIFQMYVEKGEVMEGGLVKLSITDLGEKYEPSK